MKYVICEPKKAGRAVCQPKYVVLFSDHICHVDAVPKHMKAVSAGEVLLSRAGSVLCSGHSVSLNITPQDHTRDTKLIQTWLTFGESMMIMASMDYDEA